jgi:glycosyltransferase involved in cell wall biosynthesis
MIASERRILLVAPESPFDDASGAQQRTRLVYDALRRIADVDVVILEASPRIAAARDANRSERVVCAGAVDRLTHARFHADPTLTAAVEQALERTLASYRAIVGRNLWATTQLVVPPTVPLIGDLDDFRYRYSRDSSLAPKVLVERTRKRLSHAMARRQLRRMRGVFFASVRDRDENRDVDSVVLPNIPYRIPEIDRFDSAGMRVLFVGSLWYRPNQEALDWFVGKVWPRIIERRPQAGLRIVGAASEAVRVRWTQARNVSAPGFVDDLAAEYAAASIVIAPIQSGGGSNIKTLEALAYGRACIISAFSHQAFADRLRADYDVLVADGAEHFAAQSIRALDDSELRARIARSGRDVVCRAYSVAAFNAVASQFVEHVCGKTQAVIR